MKIEDAIIELKRSMAHPNSYASFAKVVNVDVAIYVLEQALKKQREEITKGLSKEVDGLLEHFTLSEKMPESGVKKTVIYPDSLIKLAFAKYFDN